MTDTTPKPGPGLERAGGSAQLAASGVAPAMTRTLPAPGELRSPMLGAVVGWVSR